MDNKYLTIFYNIGSRILYGCVIFKANIYQCFFSSGRIFFVYNCWVVVQQPFMHCNSNRTVSLVASSYVTSMTNSTYKTTLLGNETVPTFSSTNVSPARVTNQTSLLALLFYTCALYRLAYRKLLITNRLKLSSDKRITFLFFFFLLFF